MQKQHGQRTPTWARVGSGSENASEKLVSSRAPRAQTGSRLLVLLQRIRDSTEGPFLQQAGCSASELDLLGLGKPPLLLSLTWPEGALWAPGVPRIRHTGAGNSLLCRNSVLALGRRKIRVIARGRGYSHGAKDKREGTALEPARSCQHSCRPPSQKQLKAQVKFPLAPVFIFWGLCTFHTISKFVLPKGFLLVVYNVIILAVW